MVRGASAAVGEMVICAVAVVGPVTLIGPYSPGFAPPTEISPPNDAVVCPATQWLPLAARFTDKVWPCAPEAGLGALSEAAAAVIVIVTYEREGPSRLTSIVLSANSETERVCGDGLMLL